MDVLFFMMGRVGVRCYSHDGAAAAAELLVVVRELLGQRLPRAQASVTNFTLSPWELRIFMS